jgi:hypothetical protein
VEPPLWRLLARSLPIVVHVAFELDVGQIGFFTLRSALAARLAAHLTALATLLILLLGRGLLAFLRLLAGLAILVLIVRVHDILHHARSRIATACRSRRSLRFIASDEWWRGRDHHPV